MGNDRDKEAEQEVFTRFSRIAREKLQFLADGSSDGREKMNQLESLYKKPEFNAEKKILNDMNLLIIDVCFSPNVDCRPTNIKYPTFRLVYPSRMEVRHDWNITAFT